MNTADSQIIEHLRSMGLMVDIYDDEPANRPTAARIAAGHSLVLASSTVLSSEIAGEFRYQAVPFIYWESSLNWNGREGLADGSGTDSLTQVNVVDNTHPVMEGIPLGPVTLTTASADFSRSTGPVAPGVQVLATHVSDAGKRTMMVADPGPALLDGGVAEGKRIFLYLYDDTWIKANEMGKKIFNNAVAYGLGPLAVEFTADRTLGVTPFTVEFTDQSTGPVTSWAWDFGDGGTSALRHPAHTYTQPGTFTVSLTITGAGARSVMQTRASLVTIVQRTPADFDGDGDVDGSDLALFEACVSGSAILYPSGCETRDLDYDDDVDQSDFGVLQRCHGGENVPADPICAE